MSTFFKSLSVNIDEVPTIIYPMIGIEDALDRSKDLVLEDHLKSLLQRYSTLKDCIFQIVIIWKDEEVMTDIWLFQTLENEETGFIVDCKTFKGTSEITGSGITASDGLIMLGREAELEEATRKQGRPLIENYVFGKRPSLPGDLNPTEDFYLRYTSDICLLNKV